MEYWISTADNVWHHLTLSDPVRPCLPLLNPVWPSLPRLLVLGNMVLDLLFWTWSMKRSYYTGVNLYCNQYPGPQTLTLFHKSVSSSLYWVLTSRPSYGDSYESNYRAQLVPVWHCLTPSGPDWTCLALFGSAWCQNLINWDRYDHDYLVQTY